MNFTITQQDGKFIEPQFSELVRVAFASVQTESAELASVVAKERDFASALNTTPPTHSPMVRFAAHSGDQLVGWSCGWFERGDRFYMANSGVLPSHRKLGIYSALLEAVIQHAKDSTATIVRSQHSVLNNAIIICKLRRGFQITGLSTSAQMGSLVELTLHLSAARGELFAARVTPLAATVTT